MSTYLRNSQIAELRQEKQGLLNTLQDPAAQLTEPGAMRKQARQIDAQIERNAPPPVQAEELDDLVREEAQIRKDLVERMPSCEEMRKAPTGALGKHQAFERFAKEVITERGEKRLDRWKNLRLRLNIGNEDPDIANLERYRPKVSTLGMHDALIEDRAVRSFPSEAFKAGYDQIQWQAPSDADVQAMRDEITELRELVNARQDAELSQDQIIAGREVQTRANKKKRANGVEILAPCGQKLFPSKGYEERSLKMHARVCEVCSKPQEA